MVEISFRCEAHKTNRGWSIPPWPPIGYRRAVDTYQIYDGTDELGIVGTVAPGLFAQEGRCWRIVYENPVGHGTHWMQPVEWVGRWKFLDGWTKVWSCEAHAPGLVGARRCREL